MCDASVEDVFQKSLDFQCNALCLLSFVFYLRFWHAFNVYGLEPCVCVCVIESAEATNGNGIVAVHLHCLSFSLSLSVRVCVVRERVRANASLAMPSQYLCAREMWMCLLLQ